MNEVFKPFVCWDPDRVARVAQTDAAALSRSTLLAVHHRFEPVKSTELSPGAFSDEQLLTEFLDAKKTLTQVFLVGDAGAGKSHLVQWMRARLSANPSALVVYLPRNLTGLRGLLDRLIEGLESAGASDTAAELRRQLEHAYSQVRDDLPSKLADAMALALERLAAEGVAGSVSDDGRVAAKMRTGVARGLPNLLRDPVSRPFFFRPGGALARFVRRQAEPGRAEDSDTRFEEHDVPSSATLAADANQLSLPAKNALRDLSTPLPRLAAESQPLAVAVGLLNEALTKAIPEVFGLVGEQSLGAVLDFARRSLLEQQRELYLFIEDLAQLRGVDRELLDAIINPAEEEGVQVRCAIRVAIAVTEGYYNLLPDGVRSRGKKFDLTERARHAPDERQDLERFASRYLKVLRVTEREIDEAIANSTPTQIDEGNWVPNRCDDCEEQAACHKTFGHVDGVGLYPLNADALRIMAHSAFHEEDGNGTFNPRRLVQRVLVRVTERASAHELELDQFPSSRLRDLFTNAPPLSATTLLEIAKLPQSDRRRTLTQFWGGGDRNKPEWSGVATAFGLASLETKPTKPGPGEEKPGTRDGTSKLPPVTPPVVEPSGVEKWFNGGDLPRSDADGLRRSLVKACTELVDWGALGLQPNHDFMVGPRREGLSNVLRPFSFFIEGQIGDGEGPDKVAVQRTITRDQGTLLLRLDAAITKGSAFRVGLDDYCEIQDFVEDVADESTECINGLLWQTDADRPVQSVVSRLVLGALTAGTCAGSDALSIAETVLNPDAAPVRGVSAEWKDLVTTLSERRRELAGSALQWMSYRQGEDVKSTSLLRSGRLVFHLDHFLRNWGLPTKSVDYGIPGMAERLTPLRSRELTNAVKREVAAIADAIDQGRALIGAGGWNAGPVVEQLRSAVDTAYREGIDVGRPEVVRALIEAVERVEIEEIPDAPSPGGDATTAMLACATVHATGLLTFFDQLDQIRLALERGLLDANSHLQQGTTGAAGGLGDFRVSVERTRAFMDDIT
jgi:hypothetical protein